MRLPDMLWLLQLGSQEKRLRCSSEQAIACCSSWLAPELRLAPPPQQPLPLAGTEEAWRKGPRWPVASAVAQETIVADAGASAAAAGAAKWKQPVASADAAVAVAHACRIDGPLVATPTRRRWRADRRRRRVLEQAARRGQQRQEQAQVRPDAMRLQHLHSRPPSIASFVWPAISA